MKIIKKSVITALAFILIPTGIALGIWLLSCPTEVYKTIGNIKSREEGERVAVPHLAAEIDRYPEAELYRIVWLGPDPNKHALIYDRKRKRLGYEDDVFSGISGKAYIVDEEAIRAVAGKRGRLEDFKEYDQSRR